ncbi:hypothetical protein Golomagni_03300 [Golovinomyces magnicellulatus]|nr:hypothetical protein Golomagni_03300 [Golovinomyces magnicellulatus]
MFDRKDKEILQPSTPLKQNDYRGTPSPITPHFAQQPQFSSRPFYTEIPDKAGSPGPFYPIKRNDIHPKFQEQEFSFKHRPTNSLSQPARKPQHLHEMNNKIPVHEIGQYGGSENSLDLCIGIFYDTCLKAGVQHRFFKEEFSIMLKGSAREYYHIYLLNRNLSFDEIVSRIRNHFETAERQQLMMSKWRKITLKRTIE